ncbi:uncharacterized protein LOC103940872 [Pyrus x bretschneideri]|uniref:uncharacterized protein LOC103940872 n=1 Tax=Pyrus x bretschneideri TaxID=225117 RepID=UPI00202E5E47|nr:uncharacterized protein LOC103940872 [Pyrus x bretschneideri]
MAAIVIPTVLNHENYRKWSSRIKTYLLAEDLWDIVEGTDKLPEEEDAEAEREAWKKKNVKALYAIQSSCGDVIYERIEYKTNAKEAWDALYDFLNPRYTPYISDTDERSLVEAYPTRIDGDARPTPNDRHAAMEEGLNAAHGEISNADDIDATFIKYVKSKDWDNVIKLLREHRRLGGLSVYTDMGIEGKGGTALHHAISPFPHMAVNARIVEQLVELMAKEDLEKQDGFGQTAFFRLMSYHPERVELAKCMLEKNDKLLTILCRYEGKRPLVVLAETMENAEGMARYLYSVTPHETLRVTDGAQLISLGFKLNRFDISWDLIQRYPQLAMAKDYNENFPLVTLASNRHAFLSGCRLNFWENLIYCGIRITPLPSINDNRVDVQKPESGQSDQRHLSNKKENQMPLSDQKENQRHLSSSGVSLFRGLVMNLQKLLGINRIYEMKLIHERVKQFLPLMCKASGYYIPTVALCVAAERGHVEYIIHFLKQASSRSITNEKGQNVFQIAAERRHHKVYNLIYALDELLKEDPYQTRIQERMGWTDKFGNNMLHTVARITSASQIYHIRGAALQMQRELQWFKEVESIADPKDCESVNVDNKTPRQVFTDSHNEMGKEAEKSMKETATSCTVVGALIVTIMFAAAITVPGGNNGNTGLPVFLSERVFTIFIVSDAISLFSSTTSVIMFLGILTSRYSEDDFRKSLPTKMIIGLFTLFLSIATMMIVFSCALYIMLEGKSSIVIPSILLASVPVTSFIWLQFPFLVELVISTYGPGIFDRNQKKIVLNSYVIFS